MLYASMEVTFVKTTISTARNTLRPHGIFNSFHFTAYSSCKTKSWRRGIIPEHFGIYVMRRVGIGTIPELHLRKVGILTLSDKVRIPTLPGSIPELSVHKVSLFHMWHEG